MAGLMAGLATLLCATGFVLGGFYLGISYAELTGRSEAKKEADDAG
ncbi:MAG: hypothetical protein J5J06_18060 [Phycisphaerae bacterium]|nr:hypothetical protein [Phycisphaerae bacterium]